MSLSRKDAYKAIILFGLVSLLGDTIYEGGRSITPQYLNFLGASAAIVGFAFGVSEFIGFSLRLLSGWIADKTRAYWVLYLSGYILLLSIPLIGFTNIWWVVILLLVCERLAKAIRSPARDALISIVSKDIGSGKAFGLHELLDQVGAVIGPGILAFVLFVTGNCFRIAYHTLFAPYLILLIVLIMIYNSLKGYTYEVIEKFREVKGKLPLEFKLYTTAVLLNTLGFIHVSLILYRINLVALAWIATLAYLIMQAVDAISAPISGLLYDRLGRIVLIIPFILSIIPSILTLSGGFINLIISIILYGIVYGAQESIYRAAVADIIPIEYRGTAYGIFNALYGLGFLINGVLYGSIIDLKLYGLGIIYTIIVQVLAVILLLKSVKIYHR